MEYLVVKVELSYAILLDENSRFLYAANLNYQVGDRVQDPVLMRQADEEELAHLDTDRKEEQTQKDKVLPLDKEQRQKEAPRKKKKGRKQGLVTGLVLIAAMFGMFFVGSSVHDNFFAIYTSIIMKINPEVEMDLNKQGQVIGLKGINEDGLLLVEEYEARVDRGEIDKKRDRTELMADLIVLAKDMGFLVDGGQIQISINSDDASQEAKIQTELETFIRQFEDGSTEINISLPE